MRTIFCLKYCAGQSRSLDKLDEIWILWMIRYRALCAGDKAVFDTVSLRLWVSWNLTLQALRAAFVDYL